MKQPAHEPCQLQLVKTISRFDRGLDHMHGNRSDLTTIFKGALEGHSRRFRTLLDNPRDVQTSCLAKLLEANAGCAFGRRHGFASMSGHAEFQRRVPIVTYEELRPSIDRMLAGEAGVLLQDPVIAFEETGGTSSGSKLIPYTESALASFRHGLLPWLDDLYTNHPSLCGTSAYWSISPACREPRTTQGGIPIGLGSDATYFGTGLANAITRSLSVPPGVGLVADIDHWRYLTASYLLSDEFLGLISVWSPTFLLELLRYMRNNVDVLMRSVADGRIAIELTSQVEHSLPALTPNPQRARRIAAALDAQEPRYDKLWPELRMISCWDQAASKPYAEEIRRLFPHVRIQGKGLLATEGLTSIPLVDLQMPVLALESGFYEFIGEDGIPRIADEVKTNEVYQLIMTNWSGLYRYATGDKVRVAGFVGRTPMLEFLGRDGLACDLCGEKLTEDFVIRAVSTLNVQFAMLAPRVDGIPGYVMLFDAMEIPRERMATLATEIDVALARNPQYSYARKMKQLAMPEAIRCENPMQAWIKMRMSAGQRMGDIKPPVLCTTAEWQRFFKAAK